MIFLKPEGLSDIDGDLRNATEAIDPSCVQANVGTRFSADEEAHAYNGYFIFKYQNDAASSAYGDQNRRISTLLGVRALITELEVRARRGSSEVLHLARALQTTIALAQFAPSADLDATNANLAALISAAGG